jgi:hypothetical protein
MSFIVTQGELEFQSGLILNGQSYKVFLATTGSLTLASTISAWEAAELAATNGYAAVTGTVGTGVYNGSTLRVEAPIITGQFGPATGAGFEFTAMVIKLGTTRTRPYAVRLYDVPQLLAAGQSRGFSITLAVKP